MNSKPNIFQGLRIPQWFVIALLTINTIVFWGDFIEKSLDQTFVVQSVWVSDEHKCFEGNIFDNRHAIAVSGAEANINPLLSSFAEFIRTQNELEKVRFNAGVEEVLGFERNVFFVFNKILMESFEEGPSHLTLS